MDGEIKNKEFQVHLLNEQGIEKAKGIAKVFDGCINTLLGQPIQLPQGRELAIVRTKLEEACFFAKKAMANDPSNQKS